MDEAKRHAVTFASNEAVGELQTATARFIAVQPSSAGNGLILHRAVGHLKDELIPEFERKVIRTCLDLGVRDADFIASVLDSALKTRISPAFQGLAVAHQAGAGVGAVNRMLLEFESWIDCRAISARGRASVEVEKKRHEETRLTDAASNLPTMHFNGPVQINNGEGGNLQSNDSWVAITPPEEKRGRWKWVERASWIAAILATFFVGWEFVAHSAHSQPAAALPPMAAKPAEQPPASPPPSRPPPAQLPATEPPPPAAQAQRKGHHVKKPDPPSVNFNGPAQINNAPGNIQNNYYGSAQTEALQSQIDAMRAYTDIAKLNFLGSTGTVQPPVVESSPLITLMRPALDIVDNSASLRCDDKAVDIYREVIDRCPKFPFAYLGMAACLFKKGDTAFREYAEKARAILLKTTSIDAHHSAHDLALREVNIMLSGGSQ